MSEAGAFPPDRTRLRALSQALLSATLFGLATPASKRLLSETPPYLLAGLLYLGAALAVAPGVAPIGFRRALRVDRRNRLRLGGAILCGGVLAPVLLLLGLSVGRAASVSLWLNLEPVATACLAVLLFGEHLGRWAWIGNLGVVVAGVLLGLGGGPSASLAGLLVAGAALLWGLDNNLTATIDAITPVETTFWKGLVAGTINLGLAAAFFGPIHLHRSWAYALVLGAGSYGYSIWLYISAAQSLGAARSQALFATAPFFGVLASWAWLGESPTPVQGIAGVLIATSLVLLQLDRHAHAHRHEPLIHEHEHRHDDGHHDHAHPELDPATRHSHPHEHAALAHSHPHWPDLHHRHDHS